MWKNKKKMRKFYLFCLLSIYIHSSIYTYLYLYFIIKWNIYTELLSNERIASYLNKIIARKLYYIQFKKKKKTKVL